MVLSQSLHGVFRLDGFRLSRMIGNSSSDRFMISFKGKHYPKDVILFAVFFYVRYAVSYHDLEEIMKERGVDADHATLHRWVIEYGPLLAEEAQKRKRQAASSWRMDETYTKVKGQWMYLYRAVDKFGKSLDFMLSERRDEAAAEAFFRQAVGNNGIPEKVVIDKSGANQAGLLNLKPRPVFPRLVAADRDPAGQISKTTSSSRITASSRRL